MSRADPDPDILPLREAICPTTLIEAPRLQKRLGVNVTLASETFQYTGSFKFRAAYNLVSQVPQRLIITASSGNFGQAIACACRMLGKAAIVVMPDTSARVKIEAVMEFGGHVDLIHVPRLSRADRVAELARQYPNAYVASAYDDPLVIEGNATLGEELSAVDPTFDLIVAPVGGGGLTSGLITGVRRSGKAIRVIGVEPEIANDAARSLQAGEIVRNEEEPRTIADGVRTISLGRHNWEIIKTGMSRIIEVPEEAICEAVRLLFSLANLKAEPTGALSLAALLVEPYLFHNKSVCCVVSGGNVDPQVYLDILGEKEN